jgi:hypothetical protein
MKKKILYLLLSFFTLTFINGCSDNFTNVVEPSSKEFKVQTTGSENGDGLEFYVWHWVPAGQNPAVSGAFIEIYQRDSLVYSTGVTDETGKISIPLNILQSGSYRVYGYTIANGFLDYYGFMDFHFSGESKQVKVQVNHS